MGASSSDYSEWNTDKNWSSQQWEMNLIARAASTLSFSASGSLGKGKLCKSEPLECES